MIKVVLPRTLHLTSPLMHGKDAERAQKLLHDNIFEQDFMHGAAIDGQFGTDSASAAARAHYWVGDKESQPVMGQRLSDLLTGQHKLPPENLTRRKHRLELAKEAAKKSTLGQRMLREMVSHIGLKESPAGSNVVMFNEWYYNVTHEQALKMWTPRHPGPPWCAISATYCGVKVGSKAFVRGERWAYVPYIYADAKAGRHYLSITHNPVPGDMPLYDWERNGVADHVGFFERWRDKSRGEFIAVEGNTAYGNNSNGGEVMRRGLGSDVRHVGQVQAFVHVSG